MGAAYCCSAFWTPFFLFLSCHAKVEVAKPCWRAAISSARLGPSGHVTGGGRGKGDRDQIVRDRVRPGDARAEFSPQATRVIVVVHAA